MLPSAPSCLSITLFVIGLSFASLGCRMKEGEVDPPDPVRPGSDAHVRSVHPPAQGDVAPIVRGEYDRARESGRRLVVYMGAPWCEPCERFHHAVENGELDAMFPTLTLLEFDADRDTDRLGVAGYSAQYIPMFALPKADGTASGKRVEGGVKGDGALRIVSEKLKGLLAQD
jgi:thiol-disulfide isomerase/thioredoxin